MPRITIKNLPEDLMEALREEAAEGATSMSAVVRAALQEHVEHRERQKRAERALPSIDELRARIAGRHGGLLDESWPLLREDRDR